jgi:hypothetical protein
MPDPAGDRPDPDRVRLLRSVLQPCPLAEVAEAVSVATEEERRVYVERVGDEYRWSLVHAGGGYPLLRITARFLRIDRTRSMVGFRTVRGGVCILCDDPGQMTVPDAWAVLEFDGPTAPELVEERIVRGLATAS